MKILRFSSRGPSVELLQLAINRAGYGPLTTDGIFGDATKNAVIRFQASVGLSADGIVGPQTHQALMPWYTGFFIHKIRRGDTLWKIAQMHGATLQSILTANPNINPENLQIGSSITVPLPFDVVPTTINYSAPLIAYCVRGLSARYPFTGMGEIGRSVMGKPLWYLSFGGGENTVLYNASHHANEWITTPVVLKFFEDLCKAYVSGGNIFDRSAAEIFSYAKIYIVPAVNPDGIDLVTGELTEGEYYRNAQRIAGNYPMIPFPDGWKANIRGVDLNLQYPAEWETARRNKFALGFVSPAPSDYVGTAPLTAPESRAMYDFTLSLSPRLTLSYHTQGRVIYWKFLDFEPENSRAIADTFSAVSGYSVEETPYASGFAGFKDWFIQDFNRPGYTIEAGLGRNPLPISDFPQIYSENLGILTYGTLVT